MFTSVRVYFKESEVTDFIAQPYLESRAYMSLCIYCI